MKTIYLLSIALVLLLSQQACKKFVAIPLPKSQLTTDAVFADSANAEAAVIGLYAGMASTSNNIAASGVTLFTGLSGDELYQTGSNTDYNEFYNDQVSIINSSNATLWSSAYRYIYSINACIEGIENNPALSGNLQLRLISEVKVIRAFLYFNLVNLYGPVPLITSTDYSVNRLAARAPVADIYNQLTSDLLFAQAHFTPDKVVSTRADYFAATALLAKVYLYTAKYAQAETEAGKIIASNKFQLGALNTVFTAAGKEAIWKFIPSTSGRETPEGFLFVTSSTTTRPKYVIQDALYNAFENGDQRKTAWITVNTVSGVKYPYPAKYKKATTTTTPTEHYVLLRLGEVYLIRAEARANQNNIVNGLADLNMIRSRAGLPAGTAVDQNALLSAIEKERRSELFCEWGNRWFDLKRTQRIDVVMAAAKPKWKPVAAFYPVPGGELTANPALTQNAGY